MYSYLVSNLLTKNYRNSLAFSPSYSMVSHKKAARISWNPQESSCIADASETKFFHKSHWRIRSLC